MRAPWGRVKPGWYVLAALLVYAAVATVQWRVAAASLREARLEASAATTAALSPPPMNDPARAEAGLWFPIPGARVPSDDAHLPGAPRPYRAGVAQGFTFWPASSGVPITYGTPVIAAGSGEIIRVDEPYVELTPAEWDDLLERVADGADEHELDLLRGRQVWLRLDDGRELRYGHLAGVRPGLVVGQRIERGRVIGTVGNSGTGDGVAGRTSNARLHFEVWEDGRFVGEDAEPDEIRLEAVSIFTGP
jgi:peptidoglycan LD-endopeptidase LytH